MKRLRFNLICKLVPVPRIPIEAGTCPEPLPMCPVVKLSVSYYSQTSACILNHSCSRNHLCKRANFVKVKSRGFFPGAKVSRGRDWEWGNQDCGNGHVGTLSDIASWEYATRAGARVVWNNHQSYVYRTGYRGLVSFLYLLSTNNCLLLVSGHFAPWLERSKSVRSNQKINRSTIKVTSLHTKVT